MPEIGQALREARMRARIDVSEIEAQTKIRAKYLRALENEEWDLLPGPTFVKSFLRTYAQALGLDGKSLVEEYRLNYERGEDLQPLGAGAGVRASRQRQGRQRGGGQGGGSSSRRYAIAIGAVCAVIVVLVVALLSGGGNGSGKAGAPQGTSGTSATKDAGGASHRRGRSAATHSTSGTRSALLTLSLQPTAAVYVCLLGDGGRKLIPGLTLQPGSAPQTFHAKHFVITLGNSAVKLVIDGTARAVPPSSQAIGYSITRAGRATLPAAQQPTCQ
jgi:Helix-turn-helix domain